MATEWIDIADTALKIGLGALISGVSTYKVSSLNHKKEVEKALIEKKINILEEISESAETYFYFCTSLYNGVGGMQRNAKNVGEQLTEPQRKKLADKHLRLEEALEHRNKAISKIKILSIPEAEKALMDHNKVLSAFRSLVVFDGIMPTAEFLEESREQYLLHKDKFYSALSAYMAKVGT